MPHSGAPEQTSKINTSAPVSPGTEIAGAARNWAVNDYTDVQRVFGHLDDMKPDTPVAGNAPHLVIQY